MICLKCGAMNKTESQCSIIFGLILTIFFVIPGILYFVCCLCMKPMCSECKSTELVPFDTPAGVEKLKITGQKAPTVKTCCS